MTPQPVIIFVCEHGAAKSIVAATYFNRLAEEQGLELRAIARGTNPDPELSESTVSGLLADEMAPVAVTPQKLWMHDIESAAQIVSFCELPSEYGYAIDIEYWDDVPPVSQDYDKARDAILKHLHHLLNKTRSST